MPWSNYENARTWDVSTGVASNIILDDTCMLQFFDSGGQKKVKCTTHPDTSRCPLRPAEDIDVSYYDDPRNEITTTVNTYDVTFRFSATPNRISWTETLRTNPTSIVGPWTAEEGDDPGDHGPKDPPTERTPLWPDQGTVAAEARCWPCLLSR